MGCLRTAFTLIELLVVISIVTLLIAILLPAIGAARATARATACLSQIRQVNLAMLSYVVEYGDILPGTPGGSPTQWYPWFFRHQMTNGAVWMCPDADQEDTWNGDEGDWIVSYGFNRLGLNWRRVASIPKPTATVAWVENRYLGSEIGSTIVYPTGGIPGWSMGEPWYRHPSDTTSVAFLDGHAARVLFDELEAQDPTESGATMTNGINPFVLWNRY